MVVWQGFNTFRKWKCDPVWSDHVSARKMRSVFDNGITESLTGWVLNIKQCQLHHCISVGMFWCSPSLSYDSFCPVAWRKSGYQCCMTEQLCVNGRLVSLADGTAIVKSTFFFFLTCVPLFDISHYCFNSFFFTALVTIYGAMTHKSKFILYNTNITKKHLSTAIQKSLHFAYLSYVPVLYEAQKSLHLLCKLYLM